jgi:hypothetical protein
MVGNYLPEHGVSRRPSHGQDLCSRRREVEQAQAIQQGALRQGRCGMSADAQAVAERVERHVAAIQRDTLESLDALHAVLTGLLRAMTEDTGGQDEQGSAGQHPV